VAAICRKVAQARYSGIVRLWGSGNQTRSFTYVDDAVEGMMRLMASDYQQPVNIASSETVTIVQLFETICKAAGKILAWEPEPGPVGVNARGSDNTLCRKVLNWEPEWTLAEAHAAGATGGQSAVPDSDEEVALHFVCFVHVDGGLYELDGRRPCPHRHGDTTAADLLTDAARVIQREYVEASDGAVSFNVMALCAPAPEATA
jgi:hypothetical protein